MVFRDLKSYLASPPILSRPKPEEGLYMYLAVFDHSVSSVLLRHQEGIQKLVYYLSKMLVDTKIQYLPLGKIALALVHATRKQLNYFQAHGIGADQVSPAITFENVKFH